MATIQDIAQGRAQQQTQVPAQQAPVQNQQVPGQQPAQQPVQQPVEALPTQDDTVVTPEEQEIKDQVVAAGIKVLSEEETGDQVMKILEQGADNPAKAIADLTVTLMTQLDDASGGQIPEGVIMRAAEELLQNVAEFASEAGTLQVDDRIVAKAMQLMAVSLIEEYGGDAEETQEFLASFSEDEIANARAEQQQIEAA